MVDPLKKEIGGLIIWDMKKTEALNKVLPPTFLASVLATPPELQKEKAGAGRVESCRRSSSRPSKETSKETEGAQVHGIQRYITTDPEEAGR